MNKIDRIDIADENLSVYPCGALLPVPKKKARQVTKVDDRYIIQRFPIKSEYPSISDADGSEPRRLPPFSSLLFCGSCHKPLYRSSNRDPLTNILYKSWKCHNCEERSIREAVLVNILDSVPDPYYKVEVFFDRVEIFTRLNHTKAESITLFRGSRSAEFPPIPDTPLGVPHLPLNITCGLCGRKMVPRYIKTKETRYIRWTCIGKNNSSGCQCRPIRDASLRFMLSNVSTYDQIDTIEVYPDAIQIHFGSSSSEPNDSTKPIVISRPETNEFPSYNDPAYARKNKLDELPFLGKVYCGECGKAMHRGSMHKQNVGFYFWRCPDCKAKLLREAVLEYYLEGIRNYERIEISSDKVVIYPFGTYQIIEESAPQPLGLPVPAALPAPALLPAPNLPILAPVTALTNPLTPITAEVNIV